MKIKEGEYRVLLNIPRCLRYSEIATKSGYSIPYVKRVLAKLMTKGLVIFTIDMVKIGLEPTVIIAEYKPDVSIDKYAKPFVLSVMHIFNITDDYLLIYAAPPRELFDKFIDELGVEPIRSFRGLNVMFWRPDISNLTQYVNGELQVRWDDFEAEFKKQASRFEPSRESFITQTKLDEIDLYMIKEKMKNPYISLTKIGKMMGRSQQLVSYHFHRHVLSLWKYNAVRLLTDSKQIPVQVFYMRFQDFTSANAFAKTISQVYYTTFTCCGLWEPIVLFFIQLPSQEITPFMKAIKTVKPWLSEAKHYGIVDADSVRSFTIPYKGALSRGRWVWPPPDSFEPFVNYIA